MFAEIKAKFSSSQLQNELESPLLRWSLLAIAVIALWFMLLDPYLSWREQEIAEIKQINVSIAKKQRLVDALSLINDANASASQALKNFTGQLLTETTDAAAQAKLMSILNSGIRKYKLSITGRRFDAGDLIPYIGTAVSVKLTLTGKPIDIYEFFIAIGESRWLLVSDPVTIRNKGEELELDFTVSAVRKLPKKELKKLSRKAQS